MKINLKKGSINESKYSEVCDYVLSQDYGNVIPYDILSEMFGIKLNSEKEWKTLTNRMRQVKSIMVNYGIVLKNVIGVGYYILKPKQISSYCYRTYIEKSQTLLNRSQKILNNIDKKELSEIRQKEYKEINSLNTKVNIELSSTVEKSDYNKNMAYYNSLKD